MFRSILLRCSAVVVLSAFLVPASAVAAEDAKTSFKTYCSACHGETGKGDGAASVALDPKPADFSNPAFWKGKDDAYLKKVIKEGGAAVGKSPLMAGWGSLFDDAQIDGLVKLVRSFGGK